MTDYTDLIGRLRAHGHSTDDEDSMHVTLEAALALESLTAERDALLKDHARVDPLLRECSELRADLTECRRQRDAAISERDEALAATKRCNDPTDLRQPE